MRSAIGCIPANGGLLTAWICQTSSVVLMLCAVLVISNRVEARIWTFVDGTTVEARYSRSRDGYVWLEAGKKREKVSLDQVEAGDQMWVKMREQEKLDRTWTKSWGNVKHVGRFLRYRNGTVYIKGETGTNEIEFEMLVPEDQTLVRAILATHGKQDRVPSEFASEQSSSESDPADWQASDEMHIWTNVAGQQRRGNLRRVAKDPRGRDIAVIYDTAMSQETNVYFHELSDTDQQYVVAKASRPTHGSSTRNPKGLPGYNARPNGLHNQLIRRGAEHGSSSKRNGLNVPAFTQKRNQRYVDRPNGRELEAKLEQDESLSRAWDISNTPHPALRASSKTPSSDSSLPRAAPSLEARRRGLPIVQPDGTTLFPGSPLSGNKKSGTKGKPPFVDREPLVATPRQDATKSTNLKATRNASARFTETPVNNSLKASPPEAVVVCGNCGQQFSTQQFRVGSVCPHCGRTVHQLEFADGHVERSLGFWKPFLLGGTLLFAFFSAWAYVRLR